jgi:hypothetical protein
MKFSNGSHTLNRKYASPLNGFSFQSGPTKRFARSVVPRGHAVPELRSEVRAGREVVLGSGAVNRAGCA